MKRRAFLATAAATPALAAQAQAPASSASPALLTITGAIGRTNRPPFDPARDILMGKHGAAFDKAFAVDHATLARLPARRFQLTTEYDRKRHELAGPLLTDVLALASAPTRDDTTLAMRAVDGYSPTLSLAEARRYAYIVALRMDGRPLALGGLGPLWAVFEADRFAEVAAKPVDQRFASCPWAMYHIEVRKG